ncbi:MULTISPECIES: hypothetical protein [unclassified Streptomyces]|uniref:hypothetical protein n=1 Tax=unclassified Streptomyces TaxID=2593676 RepID=UPI0030829449
MRAAMFAVVCVLLAATGHVLMSGTAVSGWAICLALMGTATAAWAFAGHERGPAAVTSGAVVAQAALHTGFTLAPSPAAASPPVPVSYAREWAERLLCGDGATALSERDATGIVVDAGLGKLISQAPPGVDAGGHSLHVMHGMTTAASDGLGPAAHGLFGAAGPSGAGMLAAHLLAAVLCGLWLAYGERAVFSVLRAAAVRLWTPLQLLLTLWVPPNSPRPRVRRRRAVRAPARLLLVHSITSRGPPTGTAVAQSLKSGPPGRMPVTDPALPGPVRPRAT